MPRSGGRHEILTLRITTAEHTWLCQRAELETDRNVSELARRMIRYAAQRMPRGWDG